MSPRRKTESSTRVSSRSACPGRSGLIAKGKTEKQSAKERTALDNRFHRTDLTLSCAAGPACRSRSDAAVAAHGVEEPSGELQLPRRRHAGSTAAGSAGGPKPGRTSFSVGTDRAHR